MRSRLIKKQFWLNEYEEYLLKLKSEKACISESALIRNLILDCKLNEKPPKEFYDHLVELRGIGNNINQIARNANSSGYVDGINLKKEINKINNLIMEIKKKYLLVK